MALYYSLYDSDIKNQHQLHVGNENGYRQMREYGRQCIDLQADGDELEAIKEQFTNIPMSSGRVVRWSGNMAAFIAMNLSHKFDK